jgi:hypothetical protein
MSNHTIYNYCAMLLIDHVIFKYDQIRIHNSRVSICSRLAVIVRGQFYKNKKVEKVVFF